MSQEQPADSVESYAFLQSVTDRQSLAYHVLATLLRIEDHLQSLECTVGEIADAQGGLIGGETEGDD